MDALKELTFELRYRQESYVRISGKMVRDTDRDTRTPDTPPGFETVRGGYKAISDRAIKLNETQIRSGYQDYLFFPEVAQANAA